MSYEVLEMTDELMLSDGKSVYGFFQVELKNNNFFINIFFTEGCLSVRSTKLPDMSSVGRYMTIVSCELKEQEQNSLIIRR